MTVAQGVPPVPIQAKWLKMEVGKLGKVSRSEITGRLRGILEPWVSDIDSADNISDQTNLIADLGLDSVGILQVVLGVEKEFGISIANHELDSKLLSMTGNLAQMIEKKLHEAY
jgi:acyl carrier protein